MKDSEDNDFSKSKEWRDKVNALSNDDLIDLLLGCYLREGDVSEWEHATFYCRLVLLERMKK